MPKGISKNGINSGQFKKGCKTISFWKGKKLSKKTRLKMRNARLGKKMSETTKRLLSKIRSGKGGSNWRGGRIINWCGYVKIMDKKHPNRDKNDYVLEHRLTAEKCLGRYLIRSEQIHHINGIKTDNSLENLYLFENASRHRLFHLLKVKPVLVSNLEELGKEIKKLQEELESEVEK